MLKPKNRKRLEVWLAEKSANDWLEDYSYRDFLDLAYMGIKGISEMSDSELMDELRIHLEQYGEQGYFPNI